MGQVINLLTLKKNFEFQKVFQKGKWYSGNYLYIYALPNKKEKNSIGIAVSKKFSKSSVKRNRIRRLIKEAYRLHEEQFRQGYQIVIVWKSDVLQEDFSYGMIEEDLLKCFKKADFIIKEEDLNA